ncbi:BON domain-containing protein [Roseateles saccharophilus]|uniref:BON domain-containing protein n=1 Tax=Roseateles saccharophilus TaxID=304 RepID=A0A4R3VEE8_ROSSA|nr:BON domain-containing protein [Roseateles saccharophilus]MDG0832946.1 BON domain-containing protein [Roseateles saccharophilus]TCV02038.1 BON domain-containing protein [Roseateles saccharophilus]
MKFPKSVHAEGWLDHIEAAAPDQQATAPARADNRTRPDDRLGVSVPEVAGEAVAIAAVQSRPTVSPWLIGAGAGAALIVLAVSMSRNLLPTDEPALPPTVTGQVQPAAPSPASPEDAQLAAAPAAAGPAAPGPDEAQPAPAMAPAAQPALSVAAAPVAKATKATATETPKPAGLPAARTPNPASETLAQAAPAPAMPLESAQPVQPAATPTPSAPALAQAPAEPEDSGITAKVRMALATDAVLAAVPIAVSTEHGVVKLEGQAPDAQARERATVVAAATLGVKGVDNRLTLPPVASLGLAGNGG